MNQEQVEQIIEYLAKSPFVQTELEAAKVAILQIIEEHSLSLSTRFLRWIIKKIRGTFNMSDETTTETTEVTTGGVVIKVQDSAGTALADVTIDYTVNSLAVDSFTDSNGQVTVSDLEAGNYNFKASLDGYDSNSISVAIAAGVTAAGTIALTKTTTTTEEASTTSTTTTEDVTSTTETAAITSIIGSVTSGATEFLERLFTLADTEATRLEAEVKTTTDFFVACRDKIEAVSIRALIAAGRAGEAAAVALLVSKLKDKIS